MYIYSGNCRLGTIGTETDLKDVYGENLFIGDIVILFREDTTPDILTAIVNDSFISYSDDSHVKKNGQSKSFAIGIKNASPGQWSIKKVKIYKDVVDGEHWKDFGFRYSSV